MLLWGEDEYFQTASNIAYSPELLNILKQDDKGKQWLGEVSQEKLDKYFPQKTAPELVTSDTATLNLDIYSTYNTSQLNVVLATVQGLLKGKTQDGTT